MSFYLLLGMKNMGKVSEHLFLLSSPSFFLDDFNRISLPLKMMGEPPSRAGPRLAGRRAHSARASFPAAGSRRARSGSLCLPACCHLRAMTPKPTLQRLPKGAGRKGVRAGTGAPRACPTRFCEVGDFAVPPGTCLHPF